MMLLPGIVLKMIGLFGDVDFFFIWIWPISSFSFEIDRLQDCLALLIIATTEDEGVGVALALLPSWTEWYVESSVEHRNAFLLDLASD